MHEHPSTLPDEARFRIDDRVRNAAQARTARAASSGRRRHRLAQQLRTVADRLDV